MYHTPWACWALCWCEPQLQWAAQRGCLTGLLGSIVVRMNLWLVIWGYQHVASSWQRASVFDKHFHLPRLAPSLPGGSRAVNVLRAVYGGLAAVPGPWKAGRCICRSEAFKQSTEKYKWHTLSCVEGRAHLRAGNCKEELSQSGRWVGPPTYCSSMPLESWITIELKSRCTDCPQPVHLPLVNLGLFLETQQTVHLQYGWFPLNSYHSYFGIGRSRLTLEVYCWG